MSLCIGINKFHICSAYHLFQTHLLENERNKDIFDGSGLFLKRLKMIFEEFCQERVWSHSCLVSWPKLRLGLKIATVNDAIFVVTLVSGIQWLSMLGYLAKGEGGALPPTRTMNSHVYTMPDGKQSELDCVDRVVSQEKSISDLLPNQTWTQPFYSGVSLHRPLTCLLVQPHFVSLLLPPRPTGFCLVLYHVSSSVPPECSSPPKRHRIGSLDS